MPQLAVAPVLLLTTCAFLIGLTIILLFLEATFIATRLLNFELLDR